MRTSNDPQDHPALATDEPFVGPAECDEPRTVWQDEAEEMGI